MTTAMQVDRLRDMATNGQTLPPEDIKYLKDTFSGWKLSLFEKSTHTIYNVADTFSIISKTHVLRDDVIEDLAIYGFQKSGDATNAMDKVRYVFSDIWDRIRR